MCKNYLRKLVLPISLCCTINGAAFADYDQSLVEGDAAYNKGHYEEAEKAYSAALVQTDNNEKNGIHTATAMLRLAKCYRLMKRFDEASTMLEKAMNIIKEKLGIEHQDYAQALANRGDLNYARHNNEAAAQDYNKAIEIFSKKLGPDNIEVGRNKNQLGNVYTEQHKYDQAKAMYEEALRIDEAQLAPTSLATSTALFNLGLAYKNLFDYKQAEVYMKRSYDIRVSHPNSRLLTDARNKLSDIYYLEGKYDEAHALLPGAALLGEKSAKKGDVDFGPYMADLQRIIKKHWFPPRGTESVRVVAVFKVSAKGEIFDIKLSTTSGHEDADQAALKAIKDASPLAPLPPNSEPSVAIQFAFDYNVKPKTDQTPTTHTTSPSSTNSDAG